MCFYRVHDASPEYFAAFVQLPRQLIVQKHIHVESQFFLHVFWQIPIQVESHVEKQLLQPLIQPFLQLEIQPA